MTGVSSRRSAGDRRHRSRDATDLFVRLPWIARQSLVATAGLRNRSLRYGAHYRLQLERLEASESWPPERLAELQSELLARLLSECASDSPYYRDVLGAFDGTCRQTDETVRKRSSCSGWLNDSSSA